MRRYFITFFTGLLCVPAWISAQVQDTISTIELKEVILQQDPQLGIDHKSPAPFQSLKGEQLKRRNSLNVADALRYFSGVQLKDYGGIGGIKTINVRSMGAQHTGVFYDGIQLGNAQNGQVDLGKFSLENMEELSLYQGQRTTLHQSAKAYASASTIYLQSNYPQFERGRNYALSGGIKTGSFGLFNPSLNFNYKLNERLAIRLSSELTSAHGRYKFQYANGAYDTTATRHNAAINAHRLEVSLHKKPEGNDSWNLKFYHYDSERGLPGAIVANRFKRPQRLWDRSNFVQGEVNKALSQNYTLSLRGKYAANYSRYVDPEITTTTGLLDNQYHQQEYYLSLTHTYALRSYLHLSLATDYQYNSMRANLYRFAYPKRNTVLNAVAANLVFKRFHVQASVLSTTIWESVEFYESGEDFQEYSPSLLFNIQPFSTAKFRLRGFYKKIFRMPTFNDLYYTFVGNTFLSPEYSEQINLGFSWKHNLGSHALHLSGNTYRIWITDKIVAVPGTNLFRWTMLNLGKVVTDGVETNFDASGPLTDALNYTLSAAYTYQQALDQTPGSNSFAQQIPYIPKHSGSLTAGANYSNLDINYSFIYTGGRYSQKANISSNYLKPWYTHDLSLQYSFKFLYNPTKIGLEVNNLLDQHYAVIKNFPMPGRSFRITCNYTI